MAMLRAPLYLASLFTCLLGLLIGRAGPVHAQSTTTFTYQGYLEEGGGPAAGPYDLRFVLYDSDVGGSQVGDTATREDVVVTGGVFAVELDFGAVFGSELRYLEVAVRDGGSAGSFTTLSPREVLRPAPSAIAAQTALSLPNVTVDADGKVGIGTDAPTSELTVSGAIETTTGGIIFPDGTSQTTAGVSSGNAWSLGGNAGTDPSTDYLGTSDDTPLELRVNDKRLLRFEPATRSRDGAFAPNIIVGHPSNAVAQGVYGATIGGGGFDDGSTVLPNLVESTYGTISGGADNKAGREATVGGGRGNAASGMVATVGGGSSNTASGLSGTVGGGSLNTASADRATVAGGLANTASGSNATVGGGGENVAGDFGATVPGGRGNEALSKHSFAIGHYARVRAGDEGTFIWSDNSRSRQSRFESTGPHQFLVRAKNFVGFNRNTKITGAEAFGIRANASSGSFGGMYMETNVFGGLPFYGYATAGTARAYHYYDPASQEWVLNVGGTDLRVTRAGDLIVRGRLSKGSGSFTIDHPLAPTEKTLSHSFVESPDMMNVYNGNVTLGADGTAVVELPDYFEALNTDFRYQLTPIGAPGPNLHVAREITGNRFEIAGGTAGMRVSWQVTGIRNDPYAQKHRIAVEEMKAPSERGQYLHPDAYGASPPSDSQQR